MTSDNAWADAHDELFDEHVRLRAALEQLDKAAYALRRAQRAYLNHRGDDSYGQGVAQAAADLDAVLENTAEVLDTVTALENGGSDG